MNKKYFGLIILALIIIFLVIIYAVQKKDFTAPINEDDPTREDLILEENNKPRETIDVKYQYLDNAHIFVGELDLPTPCHNLKTRTVPGDQATEVYLDVVDGGEICAQVISSESYVINISAPKDETIIFYLNDEVVNLNIFEVPNDQDIYETVIFEKG